MADELNAAVTSEELAEEKVNPETESSAEPSEEGGETEEKQGKQTSDDGEQHRKRLGGWQRAKIKAEKAAEDAKREAEYWRNFALNAAKSQPQPKSEEPEELVEPDPETFEGTTAEYLKAVRAYDREVMRRELAQKLEEARNAETEKARTQSKSERLRQKVSEYGSSHDGYTEAVKELTSSGAISVAVVEELMEIEKSAEVLEYLADNPEESLKISRMDPRGITRELSKIEARLEYQNQEAQSKEAESQTPPEEPVTQAPEPVEKPRKSSASHVRTIYDKDISFKEYCRLRDEQEKRAK